MWNESQIHKYTNSQRKILQILKKQYYKSSVFKNGAMLLAKYHHHHPVRDASLLINANPDNISVPAESTSVFVSSDLLFASALGPFAVVGCTFAYIYISRLLIYVTLNVIASLDTPVKHS